MMSEPNHATFCSHLAVDKSKPLDDRKDNALFACDLFLKFWEKYS